jgi:multiple sugar transport system permease protein
MALMEKFENKQNEFGEEKNQTQETSQEAVSDTGQPDSKVNEYGEYTGTYEEYIAEYGEDVAQDYYDMYAEEYYVPEAFRTTRFVKDETIVPENLTKKQIKAIDKKNKENRKQYHVSNFQILKNYKKYSEAEKEHYRYLFGRRVATAVWPFFHYIILIGLAFVILYPVLFMATNSIRPQIETTDPSTMWIPKELRFENFSETFDAILWQYPSIIFNTFFINIGCSIIQVFTCALTGYGFARFKFKGRGALFGVVVLQMIVPIQIIMIPLFMQFRFFDFFGLLGLFNIMPLNLVNQPIAMFAMAFFVNGIRAGLFVLLFRQFFRGLPKELEDAAYLDGCGPFSTFVKIMVPNAYVSFLTVFIFSVVWYWNDSYVSGMLIADAPTISLAIENLWRTMSAYFYSGEQVGGPANYIVWVQAGCLMTITPILLMYVFLQKHFVEGVERSGIVG